MTPSPLMLVTWNVRYFGHGSRGLRSTNAGFEAVAGALAAHDVLPDLVALQEVETKSLRAGFDTPQIDRLAATLEAHLAAQGRPRRYTALYFPAHSYGTRLGPLYTTGLAVLVGEPLVVLDQATTDITYRRLKWAAKLKQTRICAHVRVDTPHGVLDLFNAHLSLPAFLTRDFYRIPSRMGFGTNQVAEAQALQAFVEARRGPNAILAGDFNSLPDSPAMEVLVEGPLYDAFRRHVPAERWAGFTTNGVAHLRQHIDHVLSTETIEWVGFERSHSYGAGGPYDGISDHVPKVGTFGFKAA